MSDRERAEHARICSLPFGHAGGHWWDEEQEPPPTVESLIHAWHAKAVGAAAAADAFMASRDRPTWQVITWRAQADIWRLCAEQLADVRARDRAEGDDEVVHAVIACGAEHEYHGTGWTSVVSCSRPEGHSGNHYGTGPPAWWEGSAP